MTCTETTSTVDNDFGDMVPGEQITLRCETTYYGLWGPTQIWTNSREEALNPSDMSGTNSILFENVVSNLLTSMTTINHRNEIFHLFYSYIDLASGITPRVAGT